MSGKQPHESLCLSFTHRLCFTMVISCRLTSNPARDAGTLELKATWTAAKRQRLACLVCHATHHECITLHRAQLIEVHTVTMHFTEESASRYRFSLLLEVGLVLHMHY